ncbi:hypothetical protein WG915_03550 [Corynebacterium sp. H128]|uniref:hypothetical protein n=1 Tax=unclassified Corynebacterium TaxID=2624378 RepID=UPI00309CE010
MDAHAAEMGRVAVAATSPTTQKSYDITCVAASDGGFECRGGNNAAIKLMPR